MPAALARTSHNINCQLMSCKKVTLSNQNELYKRCCIRMFDSLLRLFVLIKTRYHKMTLFKMKSRKMCNKDCKLYVKIPGIILPFTEIYAFIRLIYVNKIKHDHIYIPFFVCMRLRNEFLHHLRNTKIFLI